MLERDLGNSPANFTIMSRGEYLEKRQPGGVRYSNPTPPQPSLQINIDHCSPTGVHLPGHKLGR